MISASDILSVTRGVTKDWTKQRKAEERGRKSRESRQYVHSSRVNFTDVAAKILPEAYVHASGNGRYTVNQRNMYYAAREKFHAATGRHITAQYFTATILRKYLNTNPAAEKWKITADPRGTLIIPNAARRVQIPCGTAAIEAHLADAAHAVKPCAFNLQFSVQWASLASGQRYQAVLFIEKEGFGPMLDEARIAQKFDVAIISGKGQSVRAMRMFVDHVCAIGGGVPLFVIHDFDKFGFEIRDRLTTVSDTAEENDTVLYRFRNEIDVTDLGLRLEDIEKYSLSQHKEKVPCARYSARRCRCFRCEPLDRIEYADITDEEYAFLEVNQRIEINALTAPQFIEFIETKLAEHLKGRLIPDNAILIDAYRNALALADINRTVEAIQASAISNAQNAAVPKTLRRQLQKAMKGSPDAWDVALYNLARTKLETGLKGGRP